MCPEPSAGAIRRMPGQRKLCHEQSLVLAFHKVLCGLGASLRREGQAAPWGPSCLDANITLFRDNIS